MNHFTRTQVRVRHRPKLRLVQVRESQRISPRMCRITLAGPELDGFVSLAADDHVKLFFPAPGQDKPVLPVLGESGLVYPDGAARPAMRDYTPRRYDAERQELVIEFVLHSAGPASAWASRAAPGDWIGLGGPKGSRLTPEDYETILLAGDETALPAIASPGSHATEQRRDSRECWTRRCGTCRCHPERPTRGSAPRSRRRDACAGI